jgi:hypothetical protein
MLPERLERNKLAFPLLVIGVWTAFGLFFGAQNYFRDAYAGKAARLPGYMVGWLLCGYSWGVLTPLVLRCLRRFSISHFGLSRFLLIQLPAAAVFASLQLMIYTLIVGVLSLFSSESHSLVEFYEWLFVKEFQSSFLVYAAIAATVSVYDRFVLRSQSVVQGPEPDTAKSVKPLVTYLRRVPVKDNGRLVLVDADAIDWIESYGNYIFLHTPNERHLLRETMSGMEAKLDPNDFVRIRRSAIVRIDAVREFHANPAGESDVILANGSRLTASRRYQRKLQVALNPQANGH